MASLTARQPQWILGQNGDFDMGRGATSAVNATGNVADRDFALTQLAEAADAAGNSAAEIRAAARDTNRELSDLENAGINVTPARFATLFSNNLPSPIRN